VRSVFRCATTSSPEVSAKVRQMPECSEYRLPRPFFSTFCRGEPLAAPGAFRMLATCAHPLLNPTRWMPFMVIVRSSYASGEVSFVRSLLSDGFCFPLLLLSVHPTFCRGRLLFCPTSTYSPAPPPPPPPSLFILFCRVLATTVHPVLGAPYNPYLFDDSH